MLASNTAMVNLQSQNALICQRTPLFRTPNFKDRPDRDDKRSLVRPALRGEPQYSHHRRKCHCRRRCCHPGGCRRELDAACGRNRCVLLGNALLDRDRAAHRVNDASKLDLEAVAGVFIYPAGCSLVLGSTPSRKRAWRRSRRPPTAQPRLRHSMRSALAQ